MRSQPNCFEVVVVFVVVVVVVVVVFVVVVILHGVVCKPIFMSNPTQLSSVEVVLRLSWGYDNMSEICLRFT